MSTRSFDEINANIDQAVATNDAEALLRYATELDAIDTLQAEALASRSRGWALTLRGDYTAALSHLHHALALSEEVGNRGSMADVTGNIGNVHHRTGNFPEALRRYHRALALFEEIDDRSGMARVMNSIGGLHPHTGDYPTALSHYHRALALHEELGNRSGVANVTGNIGIVHRITGDYPAALSHYHRALSLYEELGDRDGVASVTNSIGLLHQHTGDYQESLSHYHRALSLFEELGDRSGVAGVTGNIGIVHRIAGDYPEALSHYHRALSLYEELGDRSSVASVTGNIGTALANTGDYPAALSHFHRALSLYEELGNRSGVAGFTGGIGNVHFDTGDYQEALSHYHRALSLHEELGERSGVAGDTGNIGGVHRRTGDYPEALSHYTRALALHEELGDRLGVAHVKSNIVGTYLDMGSDAEAQALLQTMDDMLIDDPVVRIEREQHRATLQERCGDVEGASVTLKRALAEASEHGRRALVVDTHKALRDLAQKRNDFAGYIEHNNEFTRITEEINGKDTATKLAMQAKQREIDAREKEVEKHMAVLHSTLPKHIADRVARGEVVNDSFDNAAVLFLDVVGFTTNSSELEASVVVDMLQQIFTTFDAICAEHNVMKIKTIGDSYMAVAFPSEHHVEDLASVALAMQSCVFTWPHTNERVMFRIGLHCGPVVAGVLGTERMQYDVWGDTVNVASRMEGTSEPGRIHVGSSFALALKGEPTNENDIAPGTWHLATRGTLEIKGKGQMQTYWLESAA